MRKVYIYTLTDPSTQRIGYVGKTYNPIKRKWDHISKAKSELDGKDYSSRNNSKKTYKEFWVKSILRRGIRPVMNIIETTDEVNWQEREKFYIKKYKADGYKLTNLTEGGDSCSEGICKRVAKINHLTNEVLTIYDSISQAADIEGLKSKSRIVSCTSGVNQTSGGYRWRLVDAQDQLIEPELQRNFRIKKVGKFNVEMKLLQIYPTLLSTPDYASAHNVCQGNTKSCKGYIWRYLNNDNTIIEPKITYKRKTVAQYTMNDVYIRSYFTAEEAAIEVNGTPDRLNDTCKGRQPHHKEYKWKYNNY